MKLSYRFLPVAGVLLWAGCSLDIPAPPTVPPSPVDLTHNEWSADGMEMRHYNFNNQLQWVDRYLKDAQGNRIEKDNYSAYDVLQYFELMRVEPYFNASNNKVWKQTRLKHFLPPRTKGTLMNSAVWGYDAQADPLVYATYDALGVSTGFEYRWYGTTGTKQLLQVSGYSPLGTPSWYHLYQYRNSANPTEVTDNAWLGGSLNYTGAWSKDWDKASKTAEYYFSNSTWYKTNHDFVPAQSWEYQTTWSSAPVTGTTTPAPPVAGSSPPAPAVPAADPYVEADHTGDPLNGLALPALTPVQLVAFPNLNLPATTTVTGSQYVLPGVSGGTTTIKLDARGRPESLTRVEPKVTGAVDVPAIKVGFGWDPVFVDTLVSRTVSYGGLPVLTVNLTLDGQGRIATVDTAGSMMKIPLKYTLTYTGGTGSSSRPDSLTLSTKTIDLMTLDFTYDTSKIQAVAPFGLGAINFDEWVNSITVAIGGGIEKLPVVQLAFQAPTASGPGKWDKVVSVYDILGKNDTNRKLKGQLLWTQDDDQKKSGLNWQVWDGTAFTTQWTYQFAWGSYARLPSQLTDAALEAKIAGLLSAVDSFDVEKIFQLVNAVQTQFPGNQQQFERSASNLIDQIKAASGH